MNKTRDISQVVYKKTHISFIFSEKIVPMTSASFHSSCSGSFHCQPPDAPRFFFTRKDLGIFTTPPFFNLFFLPMSLKWDHQSVIVVLECTIMAVSVSCQPAGTAHLQNHKSLLTVTTLCGKKGQGLTMRRGRAGKPVFWLEYTCVHSVCAAF